MALRNLFIKEWRSILPVYSVFAVAIVMLHLFLLYKKDTLHEDTIFVLSLVLPFILLSLLTIGTGYYQLHVEWKTNSIYLLLSLPLRGWKVLSVKLAALLSLLLLTLLWGVTSFALILLRVKWDQITASEEWTEMLPFLFNVALNSFWMYMLVLILLLVLIQFTYLCGQLVAKFKWLVMAGAFLGTLWLILRISPLLSNLFVWTPEIYFGAEDTGAMYLYSGPFLVLWLISIGLMGLNGLIFEKEVEV
jgi:hypothetical protein